MSRSLVGSQEGLSTSSTIQVVMLVVIEQFSNVTDGLVVNTIYISDTDILYNYDFGNRVVAIEFRGSTTPTSLIASDAGTGDSWEASGADNTGYGGYAVRHTIESTNPGFWNQGGGGELGIDTTVANPPLYVRMRLRRITEGDETWDGKLYFMLGGAGADDTKRQFAAEPDWSEGLVTITWDMTDPDAGTWTGNADIGRLRFNLTTGGTLFGSVFDIVSITVDNGEARHFQDFLFDPGIYSRGSFHVTGLISATTLYEDNHSFTLRNGPYVDDSTGTAYLTFLDYLQQQKVEGSLVTISELLIDPNADVYNLSGLVGQEQTCIYRGRIQRVTNVQEDSFSVSCVANIPQPKNIHVHELTGTTSLVSGDGPKGFTDEQHMGEPLPWNNSSSVAKGRELFGLVTPVTGVLTEQLAVGSISSLTMLIGNQEGTVHTIAKTAATTYENTVHTGPFTAVYPVIVGTDGTASPIEHPLPPGWSGSPPRDSSSYGNWHWWRTKVYDSIGYAFHSVTATSDTDEEASVMYFNSGSLPSSGPFVSEWRVDINNHDIQHDGNVAEWQYMMFLFTGDSNAARNESELGHFPLYHDQNAATWIYRTVGVDATLVDMGGYTPWFKIPDDQDVLPSAFEGGPTGGSGEWNSLRVMAFRAFLASTVDGDITITNYVLHDNGPTANPPLEIEFRYRRDESTDWDVIVGTEVIGFDGATGDNEVTITGLVRGKYGTEVVQHNVGESVTLLEPNHPDCPYFVWVGSMGPTSGIGGDAGRGPHVQNPRDGLLYYTRGFHDVIPDTGTGATFQEVRDLLPDDFSCVVMDGEQLRNILLGSQGTGGTDVTPPALILYPNVDSVIQADDSSEDKAPTHHWAPGFLSGTLYTTNYYNWTNQAGDITPSNPGLIEIRGDVSNARGHGVVAWFKPDTIDPPHGAPILRWRVKFNFTYLIPNGSVVHHARIFVFPPNDGTYADWGLLQDYTGAGHNGEFELIVDSSGIHNEVTQWFDVPTADGNQKFLRDFEIVNDTELSKFNGIHVLLFVSVASAGGYADPSPPMPSEEFYFQAAHNQDNELGAGIEFEFEFSAGPMVPAQQDVVGVSYTDPASASGIKMFAEIGGQDYTGLADYTEKYQNKGQPTNALRFFIQERCGLTSSSIDDTSWDDAYTNEFEDLNTGGSPSAVDLDLSYMEHEFGENFVDYMSRYNYEMMSQIIFQHRQAEDVLYWYTPHDPSTTQIDGLLWEYPTPTITITEWEIADEQLKPATEVMTDWKIFWSLRSKGRIGSSVSRPRSAFSQASVATALDSFNPALNDNFIVDTAEETKLYGRRSAPDQYFIARKATNEAEQQVIVRRLSRYLIRESLRMPVSTVTLQGVPWYEGYTLELFDTFSIQLPQWSSSRTMRVVGFSRDFKSQLLSIDAVEVVTA